MKKIYHSECKQQDPNHGCRFFIMPNTNLFVYQNLKKIKKKGKKKNLLLLGKYNDI